MKTTMVIEKPAAASGRTSERTRAARSAVRSGEAPRSKAGEEPQVAEIERTFSVRWEW